MTDPVLPPLREIIAAHGLTARKSLGQNYILDMNLNRKIAGLAMIASDDHILEIGAGPGGLTRALLETKAAGVLAIEIDRRFAPAHAMLLAHYGARYDFRIADGLKICRQEPVTAPHHIIANLPYNVATRFLTLWLTPPRWPPLWKSLVLTLQREVAIRLLATAGHNAYGRLSVLAQLRARVACPMTLPATVFTPVPAVDSAVVHIVPDTSPLPAPQVPVLERVTRLAFGQRRKMIRSSLRELFTDASRDLMALGIDPTLRAEDLGVDDYCRIARSRVEAGTTAR